MQNKYEAVNQNTIDLLRDFKRQSFDQNDTFIKIVDNTIEAKSKNQLIEESSTKINNQCYLTPSNFPFKHVNGGELSIWDGWKSPKFSEHLYSDGDFIVKEDFTTPKVSIEEYKETVVSVITENINSAFNEGKPVILYYSAGIDSILLLSFLIKMNLLDKTRLIRIDNHINDAEMLSLEKEKDVGLNIEVVDYTYEYFKDHFINQYNPFNFSMNQYLWTFDTFKDYNTLTGICGNGILLHYPFNFIQCNKPLRSKSGYTTALNNDMLGVNLEFNTVITTREHNVHNISPLVDIEKIYGLCPIYRRELYDMVRHIDYTDIDSSYIHDAKFARSIIDENAGGMLNHLITVENHGDWSCTENKNKIFSIDDIEEEFLKIHINRKGDISGAHYLKTEISKAREDGYIPGNILFALKLTNWITNYQELSF